MGDIYGAFLQAGEMIVTLNPSLVEIIALSIRVSLTAVAIAAVIGLPLGAALAMASFPGRRAVTIFVNAMMGLPPVVVGLVVYLMLSRSGPLGVLGLLYTATAMIIAQSILTLPIITALTRQTVVDLWREYREQLVSLGSSTFRALPTILWEGRHSLVTTVLAGLGRALAEVGAVMIVGGNIDHVTRVMTTAIALETSKGDLSLALGLGIVLLTMSLVLNGIVFTIAETARRGAG